MTRLWRPNFYFSRGPYWTDEQLLAQIVTHLTGQRADLTNKA
jgi:hypothetical protein